MDLCVFLKSAHQADAPFCASTGQRCCAETSANRRHGGRANSQFGMTPVTFHGSAGRKDGECLASGRVAARYHCKPGRRHAMLEAWGLVFPSIGSSDDLPMDGRCGGAENGAQSPSHAPSPARRFPAAAHDPTAPARERPSSAGRSPAVLQRPAARRCHRNPVPPVHHPSDACCSQIPIEPAAPAAAH